MFLEYVKDVTLRMYNGRAEAMITIELPFYMARMLLAALNAPGYNAYNVIFYLTKECGWPLYWAKAVVWDLLRMHPDTMKHSTESLQVYIIRRGEHVSEGGLQL